MYNSGLVVLERDLLLTLNHRVGGSKPSQPTLEIGVCYLLKLKEYGDQIISLSNRIQCHTVCLNRELQLKLYLNLISNANPWLSMSEKILREREVLFLRDTRSI